MDARQHAHLARELIRSCGGVDEIVRNDVCRLKASRLFDMMNPRSGAFLPADVMADLEAYCGEPLYSRELVEARPHRPDHLTPAEEACEVTEEAAQLQAIVRAAVDGGRRLTANDQRRIEALISALENRERALRASVERGSP
jgi:hypothetical protein